jgi:hypothetical protein
VRRALAPAALLALLLSAPISSGCGGVVAPDLFIVSRSGAGLHADLTLLVNEEGGVNCNGGPTFKLSDPQIVTARAIQEELKESATSRLSLPPKPGSVLRYHLRDENGTVTFSDNSAGQSKVLHQLQLFVLQTAQQVCHLPE